MLIAAALTAAVAVLPAGPAHATSDAIVEETTFTVGVDTSAQAVATCPAGRRVVGGGVGTTADTVEDDIQVSGPVDETGTTAATGDGDTARSWLADVFNPDVERTYKVFALCSATSDAVVEETTFTLGVDAIGQAVATCPTGRRVVGGGVGTTAGVVDSAVQVSGPLDETGTTAATVTGDTARSWFASVDNFLVERTYKVLALCSATADVIVEASEFTAQGAVDDVVSCRDGRRAVGGGVGTTAAPIDSVVQVSGPLDGNGTTATTGDGDTAISWSASVFSFGLPQTYKVLALCAADPPPPPDPPAPTPAGGPVGTPLPPAIPAAPPSGVPAPGPTIRPAGGTPVPGNTTTAPDPAPTVGLRASSPSKRALGRLRRLSLRATASEASTVALTLSASGRTLGSTTVRFRAAGERSVSLTLTRSGLRALRSLRANSRLTLTARATDASGNRSTRRRSLTLTR